LTAQNNLVGIIICIFHTKYRNLEKRIEIGGAVITNFKNTAPTLSYRNRKLLNYLLQNSKHTKKKGYVIEAENLIYASVRVNSGLAINGNIYMLEVSFLKEIVLR
jgi:hypothetical protein